MAAVVVEVEVEVEVAVVAVAAAEARGPAIEEWRAFKERSDVRESDGERFKEKQEAGVFPRVSGQLVYDEETDSYHGLDERGLPVAYDEDGGVLAYGRGGLAGFLEPGVRPVRVLGRTGGPGNYVRDLRRKGSRPRTSSHVEGDLDQDGARWERVVIAACKASGVPVPRIVRLEFISNGRRTR